MARPRLVAEWEPQSAILIAWPHPGTDWSDTLVRIEETYARFCHQVTMRQRLLVVCHDEAVRRRARERLVSAGAVTANARFVLAPMDDTWARDFGPLSVQVAGETRLVDFRFDGWGRRYPAALDDAVASRLSRQGVFGATHMDRVETVLEGGAVETDGMGTLLAMASSVLDTRRNPGMGRALMESVMRRHLGATRILWLTEGWLDGDDTDGHIDNMVRFAGPRTLIHAICPDPEDPHHSHLKALERELRSLTDARGRAFGLIPLPLPEAVVDRTGRRLPASYVNFSVINGAVLVPQFGQARDAEALEILRGAFPQRTVTGIDCRSVIVQNGALHCMSMHLAAGIPILES